MARTGKTPAFIYAALVAAILLFAFSARAQTTGWTNEPAGWTIISDWGWDSCPGENWAPAAGCGRIIQDPTAPKSPPNVMDYTIRQGEDSGSSGDPSIIFTPQNELYYAFWWKPSDPYHKVYAQNFSKIAFTWTTNQQYGQQVWYMFSDDQTAPNGPYRFGVQLENGGLLNNCHLNSGYGDCPGSYNLFPNRSPGYITLGQWHLMEIYLKASTGVDSKDGTVRWWMDGTLLGDFTNANSSPVGWDAVNITPAWAGYTAINPTPTSQFFDHIRVSAPCPGGCEIIDFGGIGTPGTQGTTAGGGGSLGGTVPTTEIWNYDITWQCPNVRITWECPYEMPVCGAPGPRGSTRGSIAAWDNMLRMRWVPTFICMGHQMTVTMMDQMLIAGTMLDAKTQLETQRLQQQLTAEAQKDYMPSPQMCTFGTNVRGLAASQSRSEASAQALSSVLMGRDRLKIASASGGGAAKDKAARLKQFAARYCNLSDNNGQLAPLCTAGSAPPRRVNKDIDFYRTLDSRYTLDLDMANSGAPNTEDEEDIIALASNLFAHDVFTPIAPSLLGRAQAQDELMEMRSVNAMRGVALDSFANMAAMKAEGSPSAAPFLRSAMTGMGLSIPEINELLGQKYDGGSAAPLNPSYFAQMEILTKKMYQSPEFFTNLYDTPDNVSRMGVTLEAFKLMNDRDRFESALRREMMISLILELKLRGAQTGVNNAILNKMSDMFPRP